MSLFVQVVRVAPMQVVIETAFSNSCFVEKLVESPRERVHMQRRQAVAAWRRVRSPRRRRVLRRRGLVEASSRGKPVCFVASDSIGIGQFALTSNQKTVRGCERERERVREERGERREERGERREERGERREERGETTETERE